jgi:hypothetical protein
MGLDVEKKRGERQEAFLDLAHPQCGVDAMKGQFSGPTTPVPGVVDVQAAGSVG